MPVLCNAANADGAPMSMGSIRGLKIVLRRGKTGNDARKVIPQEERV